MTTLAWLGPVNLAQVKGADAPGVPTVNLTCTGDGSPSCGQIADGWLRDGRRLPGLLGRFSLPQDERIYLAGFSAGGHIIKRVCLEQRDRSQVEVVHLADAAYTTDRKPDGSPAPIPGFVAYALDAIAGRKLFVATASSFPNKNYPSGAQSLEAVEREVAGQTNVAPESFNMGTQPDPERVVAYFGPNGGLAIFSYYAQRVGHAEHATVLASQVWKNVVRPWLQGAFDRVAGVDETDSKNVVALLIGAALGYVVARRMT